MERAGLGWNYHLHAHADADGRIEKDSGVCPALWQALPAFVRPLRCRSSVRTVRVRLVQRNQSSQRRWIAGIERARRWCFRYAGAVEGRFGLKWIKSVSSAFDPAENNPQSSAVAYSARADSVIWSGDFAGSLNLASPPIPGVARKDVFVAEITSAGATSWAKIFGGTNDQFASAVAVDKNGDIYVAGFFFGQITIGQTTFNSRGKEDAFVVKLLHDGTPVWAKQIGYRNGGLERLRALVFAKNPLHGD